MLNILTKVLDDRLNDFGVIRGTAGSAGIDLRAMIPEGRTAYNGEKEGWWVYPQQTLLVPTGLSIYINDPQYAGLIMARSGIALKKGLAPANKVGLIDSDYQGPLMVALHNHSEAARFVEHGERIAQLVIVPVVQFNMQVISEFDETTQRGEGGFGHTGDK